MSTKIPGDVVIIDVTGVYATNVNSVALSSLPTLSASNAYTGSLQTTTGKFCGPNDAPYTTGFCGFLVDGITPGCYAMWNDTNFMVLNPENISGSFVIIGDGSGYPSTPASPLLMARGGKFGWDNNTAPADTWVMAFDAADNFIIGDYTFVDVAPSTQFINPTGKPWYWIVQNTKTMQLVGTTLSLLPGNAVATPVISVGGAYFDYSAPVSTVDTSEDDLFTSSILGGTLVSNGDKLRSETIFTVVSGQTARVRKYFGGNLTTDSGSLTWTSTGTVLVRDTVMVTSSTAVEVTSECIINGTASDKTIVKSYSLTGLTLTGANIFKSTGQSSTGGDLTAVTGWIEFIPAATAIGFPQSLFPFVWYKGDTLAYHSMGVLATNGQGVAILGDNGLNGYNVIQPTSGSQPIYTTNYQNSRACLVFNGTSDYLYSVVLPWTPTSPTFTIVMAVKRISVIASSDTLFAGSNSNLGANANTFSNGFQFVDGGTAANVTTVNTGTFYVLAATYDGTNVSVSINGGTPTVVMTGAYAMSMAVLGALLNSGTPGSYANFAFAELLGFNYNLTSGQLSSVVSYLRSASTGWNF